MHRDGRHGTHDNASSDWRRIRIRVVTEEYAGSVFLCLLLKLRTTFKKERERDKKKKLRTYDPICLGLQKF